ncbi:hypothetical protein CEP54_015185 [Fusarium duplospermum]|uniref:Uncharacterized protein n=1 Tax=Fusarium duplospermum TaxID=1325734 RepID=A0A428NR21_9HYPO|nr:hypothetical protein CEP54_015185 [Fusarium duplospermum]
MAHPYALTQEDSFGIIHAISQLHLSIMTALRRAICLDAAALAMRQTRTSITRSRLLAVPVPRFRNYALASPRCPPWTPSPEPTHRHLPRRLYNFTQMASVKEEESDLETT